MFFEFLQNQSKKIFDWFCYFFNLLFENQHHSILNFKLHKVCSIFFIFWVLFF